MNQDNRNTTTVHTVGGIRPVKNVTFPDGEFKFKDIQSDLSLSSVRVKLQEAVKAGEVIEVRCEKQSAGASIKVYRKNSK